jgi:membrane-bound serine protease (ClpP class)
MDDVEARELGFSKMSVDSLEGMLEKMDLEEARIVPVVETWSESMVRFIGSIAPVLMLIGLGALYTEIQSPGFGAPGIVGILLLALVFLNQYLAGLADYTELLIILLGLVALGFELFVIPGFGVAGIAGIALIVVGLILSLQYFVIPDPSLPWEKAILVRNIAKVLGSLVGAFFMGLFMFRYVLPKFSRKDKGPYLTADLKDARADSEQTSLVKAGDRGTALTFLRPSGKVQIRDDVFDVVTEGEFLEKGAPVVVARVRGNIIVVSRLDG